MNLVKYFENQVKKSPQKIFLIQEADGEIARQFTYEELYEAIRKMAGNLAWAGIGKRDRVALVLPNSPELVMSWFALNWLAAIACPIEHVLSAEEMQERIGYLEPKLMINEDNFKDFLKTDSNGKNGKREIVPVEPRDPAAIIFSSGTTAKDPKGVVESHFNYIFAGEGFCHWFGITRKDVLYTCLSLSKINAQAYSVMGAIAAGATVVVGSKFEKGKYFWKKIVNTKATVANMLGRMMGDLYKQPPSEAEKNHSLRAVANGQVISDPALYEELESRFDVNIVITYGSTEQLFGFVAPLTSRKKNANCVGRKKTHPDYKSHDFMATILDQDGQCITKPGETGGLFLRSPFVAEYWKKPELTAAKWNQYKWYRTDDIFTFDDDGDFYYVSREGDWIRKGGNSISPADVESIIFKHPKVADVAVIGIIKDSFGEPLVKAFVAPKEGETLTQEELIEYCKNNLTIYKIPDQWEIVTELVRTPTERVQKGLLK